MSRGLDCKIGSKCRTPGCPNRTHSRSKVCRVCLEQGVPAPKKEPPRQGPKPLPLVHPRPHEIDAELAARRRLMELLGN
jgi:hypothetical protein